MTIYIHFHIRSARKAERLHNVSSVTDNGVDSVRVQMHFSDTVHTFTDISHVAVQPDKDEDEPLSDDERELLLGEFAHVLIAADDREMVECVNVVSKFLSKNRSYQFVLRNSARLTED